MMSTRHGVVTCVRIESRVNFYDVFLMYRRQESLGFKSGEKILLVSTSYKTARYVL